MHYGVSYWSRNFTSHILVCQVIRNTPEKKNSEQFEPRNHVISKWNMIVRVSLILLLTSSTDKDRNPVPGIRNPRRGVQNPRLSWISLSWDEVVCNCRWIVASSWLISYPDLLSTKPTRDLGTRLLTNDSVTNSSKTDCNRMTGIRPLLLGQKPD